MTRLEKRDLQAKAEWEGADYLFAKYSTFEEIKDAEFHKLRQAYRQARAALFKYVGVDD